MFDDSPTTQLRQRRARMPISLGNPEPRREPLSAARGILLGAFAGAVSLALILAALRAVWRHFE
jgi:hypothetical protein